MANCSENSTRERILDAAEEHFAEKGISGTSLRALTRAAGVNLAAVHYHFGSKEALLDAVVERRARPVNEERLRELDEIERAAGDGPPQVEAILQALCMPGVRTLESLSDRGGMLTRLVARLEAQPPALVEALSRKHFGEVAQRFVCALQHALPHHPKEVVADRFRFSTGIFSYLFSGNFDLDTIPGHPVQASSHEQKARHAIVFLAAGLRAPVPDQRALNPLDSERSER